MLKEVHYLDTRYGMVVDESGLLLADEAHPDLNGKINLLTSKIEKDLNLPQKELDPSLKELFQKAGQSTDQVKGSYQFLSEEQQIAICTPIQLPGNRRWTMVVTAPAHVHPRRRLTGENGTWYFHFLPFAGNTCHLCHRQ